MNNQVKVKKTEQYSDSQGTHIVHRAKLVLVETHQHGGRIAWTPKKEWSTSILTGIPHDPIIISETEEIEKGDWFYHEHTNKVAKANKVSESNIFTSLKDKKSNYIRHGCVKILTLPDQFSDKHLQAIADGKMEEGEVLVKCELWDNTNFSKDIYRIYQGHNRLITLFSVKQSLEEAREASWKQSKKWIGDTKDKLSHHAGFNAAVKWVKKNS